MDEIRFIVDEQCLNLSRLDSKSAEDSLSRLIEVLSYIRRIDHPVGLLSGWGSIECWQGLNVAGALNTGPFDRDLRVRVLGLLDKCRAWDEGSDVVIDPVILCSGVADFSYGISFASSQIAQGRATGCVSSLARLKRGPCSIFANERNEQVPFALDRTDLPLIFRSIYHVENVPESDFFSYVEEAFPDLAFADGVSFRRFEGTYETLRDDVVHHLSVINDDFRDAYIAERRNSAAVSARIGLNVSIESVQTRKSRHMTLRDIAYGDRVLRCEWHSKIEPHRNRIHFYIDSQDAFSKIVIGIFASHLKT